MHKVVFRKDDKHRNLRMTACGHAGAGAKGEDLVCAACTALSGTILNNIQVWYSMDLITKPHVVVDEEAGDLEVSLHARNKTAYRQVLNGLFTISVGYAALAEQHPQNVAMLSFNDTPQGDKAE